MSLYEGGDGVKYPHWLKGEKPLSERMCTLADIFNALTTQRTYKDKVMIMTPTSLFGITVAASSLPYWCASTKMK